MSTFWGADADELDRVASSISTVSQQLRAAQGRLGREIHGSPWAGASADQFRHRWDGEYRRSLLDAAEFLGQADHLLRRNADEQRRASGVDGGAREILDGLWACFGGIDIGGIDWGEVGDRLFDLVGGAVGLIDDLLEEAMRHAVHVSGYVTKAGTIVDDYFRWLPGEAARMQRLLGDATDVARMASYAKWAGRAFTVAEGVFSGITQFGKDGMYAIDERLFRAVAVGGVHAGAAATGAWIGGMVGTAIPVPVVGTLVGVAVGAGIGIGANALMNTYDVDAKIARGASSAYRAAKDGVEDLVDLGSDAVRSGGKLLDGGANLAKKGIGALWPG